MVPRIALTAWLRDMMRPDSAEAPEDATVRRHRRQRRALLGVLLAAPLAALAQPQARAWRVGFLASDSASTRVHEGFRRGLQELGLVEGRHFTIAWRFADGIYSRLPGLAAELVRLGVDVIVAGTTLSVQAAHRATATIPIVMVAVPDPVGEGFATSLSRPGGNITGLSSIVTEVSTKHLELLLVIVPRLSRVAVLINPLNPSDSLILEQIHGVAYARGLKVVPVEASTAVEIDNGFAAIVRARAEAVIVAADSYFDVQRDRIIRLAFRHALPAIYSSRESTEAGGLMSYGQDLAEHYRGAATYVEKILKGARPGSLPIEQPTVLELVINRKTAHALGVTIPRELLLRADRVID